MLNKNIPSKTCHKLFSWAREMRSTEGERLKETPAPNPGDFLVPVVPVPDHLKLDAWEPGHLVVSVESSITDVGAVTLTLLCEGRLFKFGWLKHPGASQIENFLDIKKPG